MADTLPDRYLENKFQQEWRMIWLDIWKKYLDHLMKKKSSGQEKC